MPLKRTPPISPITASSDVSSQCQDELASVNVLLGSKSNYQHCDSAPDLPSLVANVSERKKRKFNGGDSDLLTSLKDMFSSFSNSMEKRIDGLHDTINTIKTQNTELTKCVEMMSSKHDELLLRISKLENDKKEDKKYIRLLEDKLEVLEKKNRATGIEIRNIERNSPQETKDDLCKTVINLGKILNVNIEESNIKDIYRLKSSDMSNVIITEFNTVLLKERILNNLKAFNKNKTKENKLNSSQLQLKQSTKPIFVSETLTPRTQRLFFLSRTFQKNYGYAFCWTSHGVVYLRKDDKSPFIRILSEEDLEILRKNQ